MPAQLSPCPRLHFLGNNGLPLADGYLITYDYTTSRTCSTWADADMICDVGSFDSERCRYKNGGCVVCRNK